MQQVNQKSFRCHFYKHLTELHQTRKKKECPKKCGEEEKTEFDEEGKKKLSPEEMKIEAQNKRSVKQFSKCKCAVFKGDWKELMCKAAEILREEERVPERQILEEQEEKRKEKLICLDDCKDDKAGKDGMDDIGDFLAQVKRDPCKKTDETKGGKCEAEKPAEKPEKVEKKIPLKTKESVKSSEELKPRESIVARPSQKLPRPSQQKNAKGKRCPPKSPSRRKLEKKQKEEESFCSPAKAKGQTSQQQVIKAKASVQRKSIESVQKVDEVEEESDEEEEDYDLWGDDACKCRQKDSDDDSSDADVDKKPCKPCQKDPCAASGPIDMATKSKCKWPASCRKLYEVTPAEEKQPWIAKPRDNKNREPKQQKIKTFGECFDVAKLIPDYCCFRPRYGRQFYEIKDLTDCLAKDRRVCNRDVPDVLKSLRPTLWLDMVAIHRCSLGRLEIQFFAEACPNLVKKFVDVAEAGHACRFRFTRIKEDVWIEGKVYTYDCDDAGLIGYPCCPTYPNDCTILDFEEGPGILSVSSRYYTAIDCCESIPFTISLCPLKILKGQRIPIGKVCDTDILNILTSLNTKYGCFKYDVGVKDCGVIYPKDKNSNRNRKKKNTCKDLS